MKTEPMLTYVLRRLRESKRFHKIIAAKTGVPYSTLAKISQGVVANPGVRHVQSLFDFFSEEDRCKKAG